MTFWWAAPARMLGRLRPTLGSAVQADEAALRFWPHAIVAGLLPLAAVVLALVPSFFHATATSPHSVAEVDFLRVRIDDVYTESIPFMAGALVLGLISPALGAFLVVVFSIVDLIAASQQPLELMTFPGAHIGRLVSYWLLWLLAVEVPLIARALAAFRSRGAIERLTAVVVGVAATAAFAFLWTLMTPSLIRATYVLSFMRTPQVAAIFPLQVGGWAIALVGAVAAAVLVAFRGPDRLLGAAPAPLPGWWYRSEIAAARHLVVAGLLTVALVGIVGAPWHALLLFATLAGARPLAVLLTARIRLDRILTRIPTPMAVAVAILAGMGVALAVVPSTVQGQPNTFDRLVIGIALVVIVVELLSVGSGRARGRVIPAPVAALAAALALYALALLAPAVALADNCSDPGDCYDAWPGAALAAGGTGVWLAARHIRNVRQAPPPSPPPLVPFEPVTIPYDSLHKYLPSIFGPPFRKRQMPDEANWPVHKYDTGPCVLTTACMVAYRMPDDCHELQQFRRLRDEYLRRERSGPEVITDYYRTSPHVVHAIVSGVDQPTAWREIYTEFVAPVVALVDAGEFGEAASLALARYDAIKQRYGVS